MVVKLTTCSLRLKYKGGVNLKKFVLGLICGIGLTVTTAVNASDTIQAYLFPIRYEFNGQTKQLDSEYTTLNYNGHTYVPVRFVAESMGANVGYDGNTQTISINYNDQVGLTLQDPSEKRVHVGNLKLSKSDDGNTIISGQIYVDPTGTTTNTVRGAFLNFFDGQGNEIGKALIHDQKTDNNDSQNIIVQEAEIKNFMVEATADVSNYVHVTLTVGLLNEIVNHPNKG
jgi:hypothetical protein